MNRIDRLFAIPLLLQAKGRVRAKDLVAAELFPTLPNAQAFGSLMDGASIRMMYLERAAP